MGLRDKLKRLEQRAVAKLGPEPVRINVVQDGPKGREREVEPLYSFILNLSGDENPSRGGREEAQR
jgi:hypothetical protein